MGWIGCVRGQKFRCEFVPQSFALIAPVQPVLHRFHVVTKQIQNAHKQYETNQYLSLGSNGVDWVRSLRKIPNRLRGTNFCTSSARFAPSFVMRPNSPECTQIVRNTPKLQFRVQRGGSGVFVAKNSDATSWHELLHPFCTEFGKATKRYQMHPNSTKHTKT